ncbi:DUF1134 domain-containing protein [Novosphingobium sp. EMRT-2]|uniref:DUF1134 domain-containing protein n=1 Tax=Novosphingobium sp. EMRT-2 TaxID=2571749 RepID=UPI0010BDAC9A|nr:DUF1134 domain-containing protein [Novosphingobium sp. EMRT-2]QCI94857.1 DUF1134 domain-containing protein [Novosphingobium sp. EMRT-2]
MNIYRRIVQVAAGLALVASQGALAQVQTIDPNSAIDGDLSQGTATAPANSSSASSGTYATPVGQEVGTTPALPAPSQSQALPPSTVGQSLPATTTAAPVPPPASAQAAPGNTYHEDDLIGAAEGVFGKGAKGLALMIRDILGKQGEPNGYITGREAGGALVVGLRYGSGTLHHKVEGERPVYWTGPSIGFDAGANAGNTFVLVYNLYDSEDLYHRFGAGEGQAYLVGGFNVSYLRRGDVVLIPVRMGVGLRLGVNAGYMKFSHKQNWLPF